MARRKADDSISRIVSGRHGDPFSFLGMHRNSKGGLVVRTFQPGARRVRVTRAATSEIVSELKLVHPEGVFEGEIESSGGPFAYRLLIQYGDAEQLIDDPYRFPPILGEIDVHLIAEGRHLRLDEKLGAHPMTIDGVTGVGFAVWAPNAERVSVVGDFNAWDGRRHPMRLRKECGVWEIFMPGIEAGALYKYEILARNGKLMALKTDPFAFFCEQAPGTAGIVYDLGRYRWDDAAWMTDRGGAIRTDAPVSIYEVHLGSWRRSVEEGRRYLTYAELAETLIPYVKDMGFTHIEVLPISYRLHTCVNRREECFARGARCDSLRPADSGRTDGQMQQRRNSAAEDSVALEGRSAAAPAHPDGVAARKWDDPACDCGGDGRIAEHGEPGAYGL